MPDVGIRSVSAHTRRLTVYPIMKARMNLEEIELHDATLLSLNISWAEGICTLIADLSNQGRCTITFQGVSNLLLPREQPWGPSKSINSAIERSDGHFEFEMQSGDILKVQAIGFSFALSNNR